MTERFLRRFFLVICWLLIALLLYAMSSFSGQNAEQSNALSLRVTSLIARLINSDFMDMSRQQQLFIIYYLHPFVRKLAHFCEFALLGGLIMCAALCHMWSLSTRVTVAVLCSGLCAVMDEFHQLFISGRSGQLKDVAIDFTGAVIGIACVLALRGLVVSVYRTQQKNAQNAIMR